MTEKPEKHHLKTKNLREIVKDLYADNECIASSLTEAYERIERLESKIGFEFHSLPKNPVIIHYPEVLEEKDNV